MRVNAWGFLASGKSWGNMGNVGYTVTEPPIEAYRRAPLIRLRLAAL